MQYAPVPENESERLAALYSLHILDTAPEERFDRATRLALKLFGVPIAYIALVDENRQWFKSSCGLNSSQTDRKISFCGHAILQNEPLVIPDALDDQRFFDSPLVTGDPHIRFYAGCPLRTPAGLNVATLCIADRDPRTFSAEQTAALQSLAYLVEDQLNLMDVIGLQQQLMLAKRQIENANRELQITNEFIRKAFGCYVTEQVADGIINSPETLKLGGDKREVTVLLSDLRGFTPYSEKRQPEEVVEILNRYLDAMVDIILMHGGIIDSFIGDGILVIFDSKGCDDHAQRALQCAVAMQDAMVAFNAYNRAHELQELEMGIGINSGSVVIGNIGSQRCMKFSVIGQTVNLVARIESFTIGGQILISEATLEHVKDIVEVAGQLRVKVKGLSHPIKIFDVGLKATVVSKTAVALASADGVL